MASMRCVCMKTRRSRERRKSNICISDCLSRLRTEPIFHRLTSFCQQKNCCPACQRERNRQSDRLRCNLAPLIFFTGAAHSAHLLQSACVIGELLFTRGAACGRIEFIAARHSLNYETQCSSRLAPPAKKRCATLYVVCVAVMLLITDQSRRPRTVSASFIGAFLI